MEKSSKEILFVVNPIAGGNDKFELIDYLEEFKKGKEFKYKVLYTTGVDDLKALKHKIEEYKPKIVAAVGGDGTCNLVASAIVNTEIVMGIIPFGSANGIASELKIPTVFVESLRIMVSGNVKLIDTIMINNKVCVHISDIGLNARVIKRFDQENIRGIYGYAKQFFKELWGARPSKFKFFLENGKSFKRMAHVVAIANASKYGTGAVINPNGKIDDGVFELVIVKPYPLWGLLTITAAIFLGFFDKVKYVEIRRFKSIQIINDSFQPLHIDGEIMEDIELVKVVINPSSLRVIVPLEFGWWKNRE